MALSRRKKKRAIIAGVSLAAALAVGGGMFAAADAIRGSYPPPVSQKVQDYYDKSVAAASAKPKPTVAPLTVKRTDGEPLRVLFAGDSLTGGLHASVQAKGFKWLMLSSIKKTGPVEEFSSALSGGTTLEVSGGYEVPMDLDLAVVELGTNDKAKATPIPEFQKAYVDLLNRVRAGSPKAVLVCAGVWEDVNGGPDSLPYNNVISKECTSRGGRFVTLTPIYKNRASIGPVGVPAYGGTSDSFHPNDTGHKAIADALLGQFKVV